MQVPERSDLNWELGTLSPILLGLLSSLLFVFIFLRILCDPGTSHDVNPSGLPWSRGGHPSQGLVWSSARAAVRSFSHPGLRPSVFSDFSS